MKKVLIAILAIFIISCSQKGYFIYYSYNNVTITRLDKDNNIFFYYGKFDKIDSLPKSYIKATYSGFDGGIGGFLIFKENKSIEIIRVYDSFSKIGEDKHLILNDTIENIDFIDWNNSINGNYNNVYQISNILKKEVEWNKENNSKVKAIYPDRAVL